MSATTSPLAAREQATAAGSAEIQAAEDAHRQAAELLAALEERVRAGDPDVQPAELQEARALVDHAALRVDAAKRRAAQMLADARHQVYVEAGERARALQADDTTITEAFAAALAAMHHLYEVADERSRQVAEVHALAVAALGEANQHGERGLLRDAGIANAGIAASGTGPSITVTRPDGTGTHVQAVPAHEVAGAVFGRLLADRHPGPNFYPPWSGEAAEAPTRMLATAARVLPGLATVEPAPATKTKARRG